MCVDAKLFQLCLILCDLWTVARQAPLSMGFSRQEYWSGPPPQDLPNPGIKPVSPASPALQAGSLPTGPPGKPYISMNQSWAYVCPLHPEPPHPSKLSQSTGFGHPASSTKLKLVIDFTYGNVHVPMLFSRIIPPSPASTESKSLFCMFVSPLLPCT